MSITIREMKPDEASSVKSLGRRAFQGFERLWISTPKHALVATCDGKIVGALLYKVFRSGKHKIGYVDYLFTDPDHRGAGIGSALCKEGFALLLAQGCDALTAMVKDDNVASWSLFVQNGFQRVSIPRLVKTFGFMGMLSHYFTIPYFVSIGLDYYVMMPGQNMSSSKDKSMVQVAAFLGANLLLGCATLYRWQSPASYLLAYGFLLCMWVLGDFLGTLFSKRDWRFRFVNGGAFISLFVSFFAYYPMLGRWYPVKWEKTPAFRRDMGITAFTGWLLTLVLTAVFLLCPSLPSARLMAQILGVLALYRCVPFYPFDFFGGRRVLAWNKAVFAVLAVVSVPLFLLTQTL